MCLLIKISKMAEKEGKLPLDSKEKFTLLISLYWQYLDNYLFSPKCFMMFDLINFMDFHKMIDKLIVRRANENLWAWLIQESSVQLAQHFIMAGSLIFSRETPNSFMVTADSAIVIRVTSTVSLFDDYPRIRSKIFSLKFLKV